MWHIMLIHSWEGRSLFLNVHLLESLSIFGQRARAILENFQWAMWYIFQPGNLYDLVWNHYLSSFRILWWRELKRCLTNEDTLEVKYWSNWYLNAWNIRGEVKFHKYSLSGFDRYLASRLLCVSIVFFTRKYKMVSVL